MRDLYYRRDSKRGKERTMLWLVEEVGELSKAMRKGKEAEIKEEIADVFAWLASLANLLEIDLEKAVCENYPNVCKYCGKKPCECEK